MGVVLEYLIMLGFDLLQLLDMVETIFLPELGLPIVKLNFHFLKFLFVLHLFKEELLCLLVSLLELSSPALLLSNLVELSLLLISLNLHVLLLSLRIFLLYNCVSHQGHKVLLLVFSGLDLAISILFLLLEHLCISFLSSHVLHTLPLKIFLGFFLLSLILLFHPYLLELLLNFFGSLLLELFLLLFSESFGDLLVLADLVLELLPSSFLILDQLSIERGLLFLSPTQLFGLFGFFYLISFLQMVELLFKVRLAFLSLPLLKNLTCGYLPVELHFNELFTIKVTLLNTFLLFVVE